MAHVHVPVPLDSTTPTQGVEAALGSMNRKLDEYQREVNALRKRERALLERLRQHERELSKARTMQLDLLGGPAVRIRDAKVHTWHQPAELVSGDFHQVVRLDDHRVAIILADATGHGLSAGFLSVFAERSLCPSTWRGGSPRTWAPEDTLRRLNEDLLQTDLCGCEFVSAICAVYDERSHLLRWARAGSPYPILVRPGGTAQLLTSSGPLAGVAANAVFEIAEIYLEPGETVLFYTDGLEELIQDRQADDQRQELTHTAWFRGLGDRTATDELDALQDCWSNRNPHDWKEDDVTVLAFEHTHTAVPGCVKSRSRAAADVGCQSPVGVAAAATS